MRLFANYFFGKQNTADAQVSDPAGALGYFLGGYVPPGTLNWHPVLIFS